MDAISVSHFFFPRLPSFFVIILSPQFSFPFVVTRNGQWKLESWGPFWSCQPIWPIFAVNRLNWQCCLAGSSKTAPRIFIFSIAMGVDYSFELLSIETYAPQFIGHDKIFLGSVVSLFQVFVTKAFCDDIRPFTCAQSVLKDRLCVQYSPVIVVLLRYCLYLLLLSCFFRLFVTNVFKD